MQQDYIDFRSIDRISGEPNDFVIQLPQFLRSQKVSSVSFSNLELPSVRHTVEDKENSMAISEGIYIGDHVMTKTKTFFGQTLAENQILLKTADNQCTVLTVPASLMPIKDFKKIQTTYNDDGSVAHILSSIETQQAHGLKEFLEWNTNLNINTLIVGAEPNARVENQFRAGIMVNQLPSLRFEKSSLSFPPNTIDSIRVATHSGFIHCPPLHLQEIISLLNHCAEGQYHFHLSKKPTLTKSIVRATHKDGKRFAIYGIQSQQSLYSILGFTSTSLQEEPHGKRNPSVMRLRVPTGFYQSPPSLMANAIERSLQNRCNLNPTAETADGHSFSISIFDATYNQQIIVPIGVYTPEKLVDTVQSLCTDVDISLNHISNIGYENVGWIQYTFSSKSDFPFVLDFTGKKASALAFSLGFENKRYSSQRSYVGTPIAVAASRNLCPCPPLTITQGLRSPITNIPTRTSPRYPKGLYTIIGTSPNVQKLQIVCEPGKSWAVPNKLREKTFFNNIERKGIIDMTTKALPKQLSYDFREGDIVRLTGFHKYEQSFSISAQSTSGPTGNSSVTNIYSDNLGGRGYSHAPNVRIVGELTEPNEFHTNHIVIESPNGQSLTNTESLFTDVLGTTVTKIAGNEPVLTMTASLQTPTNNLFDRGIANLYSINVLEYMPDATTRSHILHPGEFTFSGNDLNISLSTDVGSGNLNEFLCDVHVNALVGYLSRPATLDPFSVNTTNGKITFEPKHVADNAFVFESHAHLLNTSGEMRESEGVTVVSIAKDSSLVDRLISTVNVGSTITFDDNELNISSMDMISYDESERLMKFTTPSHLLRQPPYVTTFPPTIYTTVGRTYAFECITMRINNVAMESFSPTAAGSFPYDVTTIPKTVSVNDGTYGGLYVHTPQRFNMYVFTFDGNFLYLHQDGTDYGWRISDIVDHANTSHPWYGQHLLQLSQNQTKEVSFTRDASIFIVFSDSKTLSGSISALSSNALSYSFEKTAYRPGGMVHPSIQPVMLNGRVACYNVSNTGARYLYPPSVEISDPSQKPGENDPLSTEVNTIQAVFTTIKHNPERILISLQLSAFPPELKNMTNIGEKGFVAAILDENGKEHLAKIVHTSEQQLYKYEMKVGYDGSAEYGFDGVGSGHNDRFGELSPNKQVLGYTIKTLELKNNRFKFSVDTTNKEKPKRGDITKIYLVDKDSQGYIKEYSINNIDKFQDTGDTVKWFWDDDVTYWSQRVGKSLDVIIEVEKNSEKTTVTLSKDYYESSVPSWISTSKSFRIVPGRAIHLNHTTLGNGNQNYCLPCMPDLITKQRFWGQEMPLSYGNVVPIQNGVVEGIRSIATTGTAINLNGSVAYKHTAPATSVDIVPKQIDRPVTSIIHSRGKLYIQIQDLSNLHVDDHISLVNTLDNTIVIDTTTIVSFNLQNNTVEVDISPSSTRYWHETTYETTDITMVSNTRCFILSAPFDYRNLSRDDWLYLQGTSEESQLSESEIISGFYQVDRYSSVIANDRSQIFLHYKHRQTVDIENKGNIVPSPAKIRLQTANPEDWSLYSNGVRLQQNGTIHGIFAFDEVSDTEIDLGVNSYILPSDIGNPIDLIIQGEIRVTKMPSSLPPLVAGEKIVIAGTSQTIQDGPYVGKTSFSFGHTDGRTFDGIWIVKQNEANNSFTLQYDSSFLEGGYTDPSPQEAASGIPTMYSRAIIGRLSNAGAHAFDESLFCRGYDILSDSTWRLRIFNTANPSSPGITDLGVGGFMVYNPKPTRAHAIAQTVGTSLNYSISNIISALPGFVTKHDDPSTTEDDAIAPPLKIAYAEGITSQLNTSFTGSNAPLGHATAFANIEDGHIVPHSHLPSGAIIEGKDKYGNPLTYNIVSMYIPGRMTYENLNNIPRTLMNIHRLRLILSKPYTTKFYGPITISGDDMVKGAYDAPLPIEVENAEIDVNSRILCTGNSLPGVGDIILSDDLPSHHYVGAVTDNQDGTYSVEMFPAQSSFVGTTSVTFENVTNTVAYDYNNSTSNYEQVSNSNLGSSNTSNTIGKYTNVPTVGTKTSVGSTGPLFDDDKYTIPPRIEGQEIEIISGTHTTLYGATPTSSSTPNDFFEHMTHGTESAIQNTTQIFSWGPISNGVTDAVLSVPTVCFPGSQNLYFTSDMNITYGGDYTTDSTSQFHADASMTIVNENQTRIGIVTFTDFDPYNKFRIVFEYNPNGLRNGKGFDDTTREGNIFLTFSRVFEPRLEILSENTDALAVFGSSKKIKDMVFSYDVRNLHWPDTFVGKPLPNEIGHALLSRQKQNIGTIIGATRNLFGRSSYILPSQWNLDPQTYRLLVLEPFTEVFTAHSAFCEAIDECSDGIVSLGEKTNNTKIFMKLPLPSAYHMSGPQPRQFSLMPPINLNKLRIRILDFDMTPHPLHGRELSISLVFDKGKSMGQRKP